MHGFRDTTHRSLALKTLLGVVGLGDLWTANGPVPHADNDAGVHLSPAQDLVVRVAMHYHDGSRDVRLSEVQALAAHEPDVAQSVMTFIHAAMNHPAHVDQWIAVHELELRGERLTAMRRADHRRWLAALRAGARRCSSKEHMAELLGVSISTLRRWADADADAAEILVENEVHHRKQFDPKAPSLVVTLRADKATVTDAAAPYLGSLEFRIVERPGGIAIDVTLLSMTINALSDLPVVFGAARFSADGIDVTPNQDLPHRVLWTAAMLRRIAGEWFGQHPSRADRAAAEGSP